MTWNFRRLAATILWCCITSAAYAQNSLADQRLAKNYKPFTAIANLSGCFIDTPRMKHPLADQKWIKPHKPFRVVGNLYYVGTSDLSCYLITTPQGHILINEGVEETVPMLST